MHGERVAQRDGLQFQIAAILNPAVAETAVTQGILESSLRNIGHLSFSLPTTCECRCLIHEAATTFKLTAHIVIDIVSKTIVEINIKFEALISHRSEDVTIDVGIRITDEGTVGLSNLMVTIDIVEVNITGTEIIVINTIVG